MYSFFIHSLKKNHIEFLLCARQFFRLRDTLANKTDVPALRQILLQEKADNRRNIHNARNEDQG